MSLSNTDCIIIAYTFVFLIEHFMILMNNNNDTATAFEENALYYMKTLTKAHYFLPFVHM